MPICHGFTKVDGHTGGFYHIVCRHGVTAASKFLTLQESVRDPADLYLSLKHYPLLFICDTPCGFVRHMDFREPETTKQLWGPFSGCLEQPTLKKKPSTEYVYQRLFQHNTWIIQGPYLFCTATKWLTLSRDQKVAVHSDNPDEAVHFAIK